MLRREALMAIAALAAAPAAALAADAPLRTGPGQPFNDQTIRARARALAAQDYAPRPTIPQEWLDLSYDEYRKLWFDTRNALWADTDLPVHVDAFPPGLYFPRGVEINVVSDGQSLPLVFDMDAFDRAQDFPDLPLNEHMGYSGIRLRGDLTGSGNFSEYAVFQGASYFRGIGTGQTYGLSARGLALKTGDPMGEEFPDFTALWIERPGPQDRAVVVHALLDSPSCTGVYRFEIAHGDVLDMEVEATIFARTDLTNVGIAPLTSMFLFDQTMRNRFSDFRPNVHDSDGLLIHNGGGEVIWRPLANPTTLQISAFGDNNPKGFGLMQRKRAFGDYNDLEALYHDRPSAWITPRGDWGPGSVTLVEIPADLEIYDNIVAYWRPSAPIPAGGSHDMRYRLQWGADPSPPPMGLVPVRHTAMGGRMEGGLVMAIDFDNGDAVPEDLSEIDVILRSSHGRVSPGILQRNPETNGPRLAFTFHAEGATYSEFRVQLRTAGAPLSEVWLYRWTQS
ncbi:glucan biosynthesis protein G [Sulfitobacter albidus]|uniref:Glucan biosynthesis protein G n=1 Tax=Sulfitobacter albidus TaxID=2829501 RepID=A0A975JEN4_9RHOB|nr:glucan biosynthesis protein G [Sulfitobacter albidus]QUJ76932.1 glucan biosynthesis protein G [Sulfitobacter albidus]